MGDYEVTYSTNGTSALQPSVRSNRANGCAIISFPRAAALSDARSADLLHEEPCSECGKRPVQPELSESGNSLGDYLCLHDTIDCLRHGSMRGHARNQLTRLQCVSVGGFILLLSLFVAAFAA